jgi:hypothetical protein
VPGSLSYLWCTLPVRRTSPPQPEHPSISNPCPAVSHFCQLGASDRCEMLRLFVGAVMSASAR